MTLSVDFLTAMVYLATILVTIAPIVLVVLLIKDRLGNQLW